MKTDKNGTRFKFKEKDLERQQTDELPNIVQLRREFAEHPSAGLTPPKLAAILKSAEEGDIIQQCYLAEDLEEKNGHLYAELFKRKMALTTVDFEVQPPRNASAQEQKDAAAIQDILKDIEQWSGLLFDMADGILKGFSNLEFTLPKYRDFYIPDNFQHREAAWFQLSPDDQDELRLRNQTAQGEALEPIGWIQHRHRAKSGYVARSGLVRQLAWPHIFGTYSVRDFAEFLEIYGLPIRIGKYPTGASANEKKRLMQAVMSIGHNAGGIMPKGMEMDFQEAAKGGGDPFMKMTGWSERTISKTILGQTLSADAGDKGSHALGAVHNEVRMDIRDHDLGQLAGTLNRDIVRPLYMLNGKSYRGDPRRMPRIVFDTQEPEDLKLFSESLPALVDIGMAIPEDYAHEKLRIPKAEKGQRVLSRAQSPAKDAPAALTALAALKGQHSHEHDEDVADKYAAQLKATIGNTFDDTFLAPLFSALENADNYDDFLDGLAALEGKIPTQQFQQIMQQGLMAAEMAGRYDVSQGN